MTARRAPLLLFLGLFALAGCRDALVDEPFQADVPPSVSDPVENAIYVKGPGALAIDATGNYRAQSVPGVVRYDWSQDSIDRGQVSGEPTDPTLRLFALTGVRSGTVRITVQALDANNAVLGVGSRTIFVGQ
jgi:hypothetical protein